MQAEPETSEAAESEAAETEGADKKDEESSSEDDGFLQVDAVEEEKKEPDSPKPSPR